MFLASRVLELPTVQERRRASMGVPGLILLVFWKGFPRPGPRRPPPPTPHGRAGMEEAFDPLNK
eukprot:1923474-Pyramimonas_sp.AAC.1